MKIFSDPQFIHPQHKLVFGIPHDFEHNVVREWREKGYELICLQHISAVGKSHSELQIVLGMSPSRSAQILAETCIESWKDLPKCLIAKDGLDGGLIIRPFRLIEGSQFKTHARGTNNQPVFVDLVEEPPVRYI